MYVYMYILTRLGTYRRTVTTRLNGHDTSVPECSGTGQPKACVGVGYAAECGV